MDADIAGIWQRVAWFLAVVMATLLILVVLKPSKNQHACKLGCEGILSKRLGSRYRSGRSPHWLKIKNPAAPAVKREAEEELGTMN